MYFKDGKIYQDKPEEIVSSSTSQTIITSSRFSLKQLDFEIILIFILLLVYIYLFVTKHYVESGFIFAFLLGMMI
jgi:hypothetical protein